MFKKKKIIFCLILFLTFTISIIKFYFSDENVQAVNKSRSFFVFKNKDLYLKLPLLKNDTIDIIEYRDDIEVYKNKKKRYKFEDLIDK